VKTGQTEAASVREILARYRADAPLARAFTLPAPFYTEPAIADAEREAVFARSWQMVGRLDQLRLAGDYVTAEVAGEPVVVVRDADGVLRGFFNVCRHHAAAVLTASEGNAPHFVCPYHGWTYALDGALEATPHLAGICDFDTRDNGLVPLEIATWEQWVFARLVPGGPSLPDFLGAPLVDRVRALNLPALRFVERRRYALDCNWKVYVDNYLDGGYHVPHLHHGLDSVLAPGRYTITNGEHCCVQSSAIRTRDAANPTAAVRQGESAHYVWIHPNFMINWYEGVMDTNLVRPLGVDRTEVIFDFYFTDVATPEAVARCRASIDVGNRVQDEDLAICDSVQRGLASRAYRAGRLSVRREGGEHVFHRTLAGDLKAGLNGR